MLTYNGKALLVYMDYKDGILRLRVLHHQQVLLNYLDNIVHNLR